MKSNRPEYWSKILSERKSSELSIRAFCGQRGISEHSFYRWRKRLAMGGPVRFAELTAVATAEPASTIELMLTTGERLGIADGVNCATLRLVLECLRP